MLDKLTDEDVNEIFYAFDCDESGSEHTELRAKLYRLFPAVKEMHEEREQKGRKESKRQDDNRRTITTDVLDSLDLRSKILPQLAVWVTERFYQLRSYNSDEICLAGDIWRYADETTKRKISLELSRPYSPDTWHELSRYFSSMQSVSRSRKNSV